MYCDREYMTLLTNLFPMDVIRLVKTGTNPTKLFTAKSMFLELIACNIVTWHKITCNYIYYILTLFLI